MGFCVAPPRFLLTLAMAALPSDTKDEYTVEKDYEKGHNHSIVPEKEDKYHFDAHDLDQVQRKLHQRHVQM
jgi:hypothetical protein